MITSDGISRRLGSARRKAFTLVELLVVIGIIAMLISILLPSLAKARSAAYKVACAANMRSIGQMFRIYEASNKGRWPLAKNAKGDWNDHSNYLCAAIWPHAISPQGEPTTTPPSAWTPNDYDKHVANMKAFVCPAQAQDPDIQRTYVLSGQAHWLSNQSCINTVYGYLPQGGKQICATSRTPSKFRSSETIMMAELKADGPVYDWITNAQDKYHIGGNFSTVSLTDLVTSYGPWAHDFQGSNYLFCDGHVEYQISPVRYSSTAWAGNFDNAGDWWCGGTRASVMWTKQFNVDKGIKAGNDPTPNGELYGAWWETLPNP